MCTTEAHGVLLRASTMATTFVCICGAASVGRMVRPIVDGLGHMIYVRVLSSNQQVARQSSFSPCSAGVQAQTGSITLLARFACKRQVAFRRLGCRLKQKCTWRVSRDLCKRNPLPWRRHVLHACTKPDSSSRVSAYDCAEFNKTLGHYYHSCYWMRNTAQRSAACNASSVSSHVAALLCTYLDACLWPSYCP
jgi:hypothetical protein